MTSRLLMDARCVGDHEDVEEWRIDRLLELGFRPDDALLLAVAAVDWHEAQRLLAAGCDHNTATRILT